MEMSPVHSTPVELLREIFLYAAAGDSESVADLLSSGANTAWSLHRVCRKWNCIAATLELEEFVCTKQADISIRHAKDGHLSVMFNALYEERKPSKAHYDFTETLSALLSDCSRWKSLVIASRSRFYKYLELLKGRLSGLQRLEPRTTKLATSTDDKLLSEVEIFLDLPKLDTLVGSPNHLLPIPLPLLQIKHFRTTCVPDATVSEIRDFMEDLTNLETWYLTYDSRRQFKWDFQKMTLQHVTHLTIPMRSHTIFCFLILPSLEDCTLTSDLTYDSMVAWNSEYRYFSNDEIRMFFGCASSAVGGLKRLRVIATEDKLDLWWERLLEGTPSLQHLEIERWGVSFDANFRGFFKYINKTPSEEFLPQLQSLTIKHDEPDWEEEEDDEDEDDDENENENENENEKFTYSDAVRELQKSRPTLICSVVNQRKE